MEPKAYESPKTMRSETRTPFYGRKGAGFEQTSARAPREAQLFSRHREQAQNTHCGVETKRTSKVFMPRRKNRRRKIISNDSENKDLPIPAISTRIPYNRRVKEHNNQALLIHSLLKQMMGFTTHTRKRHIPALLNTTGRQDLSRPRPQSQYS